MRDPQDSDRGLIDVARSALFEITDPEAVGPAAGLDDEAEGVVDVFFTSTMPGYPGWRWTVSLSVVDGVDQPSVLETELTPGDGALLAPDWVPWADRLAEYRAAGLDTDDLEGSEDDDPDDDADGDEEDDEEDDEDDDSEVDDHDSVLDPIDDIDGVDFEDATDGDDADDHDDADADDADDDR
ncbi:MAG: DUF3027 domain-containing protein [Naasia sp.]